jgi:drug/metabolite transporter (DMT)-like permease
MYQYLLVFHSLFRWLVLASLLLAIYKAFVGYYQSKPFTKSDNSIRHWTATIAHTQLIIGIILYIKSPITQYFWSNFSDAIKYMDTAFFGLYHFLLMLTSVVLVTIGSALAKRKPTDKEKFKTMLFWFCLTLLIIFIAIPWPFMPWANRPYFRTF